MGRKYELLTDDTIIVYGHKLFRIRANVSFDDVEAGTKGGYIESDKNLAHDGDAWICENAYVLENARVFGDARVYDNAQVYGNAQIYGNAQVYGNAWVYGNANIYGYAHVYGNVEVFGHAVIYGCVHIRGYAPFSGHTLIYNNAHYLYISPIGSRGDEITFMRTKEHKIAVVVGCFRGDIDQFEAQVKATHGENEHAKAYMLAAQLARARIDLS